MAVPEGWRQYKAQRESANRRSIPFLLTFDEWWEWWQVDDRWRGRGLWRGGLVMARNGDVGAYALDNIHCAAPEHNLAEVSPAVRREAARKAVLARRESGDYQHLRDRAGHPRARPVVTPLGSFPSAALAAEAHKITRQHAAMLARTCAYGWRYAARRPE